MFWGLLQLTACRGDPPVGRSWPALASRRHLRISLESCVLLVSSVAKAAPEKNQRLAAEGCAVPPS